MISLCILCSWVSLWRMTWAWKERDSHWPAHSNIHLPESGRQHISLDLCPGHGRSALGSPAHCSQKGSERVSVEAYVRRRVAWTVVWWHLECPHPPCRLLGWMYPDRSTVQSANEQSLTNLCTRLCTCIKIECGTTMDSLRETSMPKEDP